MVFPWFFHGFSWCSPWKQLDVENLTIFQTAFPTSQVKSVAQPKPGAPPRISSMEKMHVCIEKTSFYIQYIVIYIYIILISYWFHIDFILYYCITSWLPRLKLHENKKSIPKQTKCTNPSQGSPPRKFGAFDEKKPMAVVQHGLDMIGLRDNVLPIVGVLFFSLVGTHAGHR